MVLVPLGADVRPHLLNICITAAASAATLRLGDALAIWGEAFCAFFRFFDDAYSRGGVTVSAGRIVCTGPDRALGPSSPTGAPGGRGASTAGEFAKQ